MDEPESRRDSTTSDRFEYRRGDTFETTREELRTTFEYQVRRLREIDNKAIEILRANLLLIGLVVTAGSILVQTDLNVGSFLNIFTLAGVFLLLVSTGLAGITYTSSNLRGGLDSDAIENAIAARRDETETAAFEDRLLRSYGRWIEYNARITAVNDMFATVTVLLVIVAFLYIGVGLVVGFALPGPVILGSAFLLQTALLFWVTRTIFRMDHIELFSSEFEDTYEGIMLSKGGSRQEGMDALREMLDNSTKDED